MHAFETLGVVSLNEIRAVTPTYQRAGSLVSHLANPKLLSWIVKEPTTSLCHLHKYANKSKLIKREVK